MYKYVECYCVGVHVRIDEYMTGSCVGVEDTCVRCAHVGSTVLGVHVDVWGEIGLEGHCVMCG